MRKEITFEEMYKKNTGRTVHQNIAIKEMLTFFQYEHLKGERKAVSKAFYDMADKIAVVLPSNRETTVTLRKLLEAKDCAVRSIGGLHSELEKAAIVNNALEPKWEEGDYRTV